MADAEYFTAPHLSTKFLTKFFKRIEVDANGCWNWMAALNKGGYGVTTCKAKWILTHRLMYAWAVGPLPKGRSWNLDHLCRNRRCCNPWHTELVTIGENVLRGTGISATNARKTHCKFGHELRPRKDGSGRYCPRCSSEASLASYYGGRRTTRQRHTGS